MSDIKLTYFPAKGRAEISRLILSYSGVKFTDERLTGEQFGALKSSLPWGQIPRGGQYFVGNNLTWADLVVFQFTTDGMGGKPPKVKISEAVSLKSTIFCSQDLRAFPRIANLCERVGQVPNIKNWMNARPVTAM